MSIVQSRAARSFNPRPRAGGDQLHEKIGSESGVSIHAPVLGATYPASDDDANAVVSIHAPVLGATGTRERG